MSEKDDYKAMFAKLKEAAQRLEKGREVKEEQLSALKKLVKERVGDCTEDYKSGMALVMLELVTDRDWEPKESDEQGEVWLAEMGCEHVRRFFVNMALQLWGDKPACTLTWDAICNAAYYHYQLEIRNAVRPSLDTWGLLAGKDLL